MKKHEFWHNFFRALCHYLLFFLLIAFVTSCCMALFISTLAKNIQLTLTPENLNAAAKLTFANVILLSVIFTLIDNLRRKYTVQLPAKRIVAAADKVIQGDFSVRIKPHTKLAADDSFAKITDCFNHMIQELQSVETLRTDFVANVSHEMKTPLAVMQNYGTLLQSPTLSDEKRIEYAKGVTNASRRMADMMTNILKLNRLENQKIFPQADTFHLGEQLCECLLQYEDIWEKSEIEIDTNIDEEIRITADAELLSLVWNNLFSNAFKFTPAGGTVSVTLKADDDYAYVQVKDTGCGMTAEVGAHIFEKFYQGDTSHCTQGNGLGLALVKRVVDILHGEISVESTLNAGTTFTVKLKRNLNNSTDRNGEE